MQVGRIALRCLQGGGVDALRLAAALLRSHRLYVTAASGRVVVLYVFAKKPRKTPRRALATARERMRQVST